VGHEQSAGAVMTNEPYITTGLFDFVSHLLERDERDAVQGDLLLFLPAALWGARRGLQIVRIKPGAAVALAMGVTALTVPLWSSSGAWIPNWALSWPAWYLVATARRN
jgi:hypothetical protein